MTLKGAIAAIDELTGRLEQALAVDNLGACAGLLEQRAEALRRLEIELGAAGPREAEAAVADLERIAARDAALRAQVGAALERLREEMSRLEAAPRRRATGEPGDLDRRA